MTKTYVSLTLESPSRRETSITLAELQRIKQWHADHRAEHPLEYYLWDVVLTLWLMGWVGWFPAYLFDQWWGVPLCCLGMLIPSIYVTWRSSAHRRHKLRCDWLDFRRS